MRSKRGSKEKEFNQAKGSELRVWRESVGASQGELAGALGINQSLLSRIESGEVALTLYRWHLASTYLSARSVKP